MPALKPLGALLQRREIWRSNRHAMARGAFIGLFCAFVPIPIQMLIVVILAPVFRANLPMAIALVWISNPLTIPPMFYFSYRLGAWLLNMRLETDSIEISFGWLLANLGSIGYPLIVGSLICSWTAGVTGFVLVRVIWRIQVMRRWRNRKTARIKDAGPPPGFGQPPAAPESRPPERTPPRTRAQ